MGSEHGKTSPMVVGAPHMVPGWFIVVRERRCQSSSSISMGFSVSLRLNSILDTGADHRLTIAAVKLLVGHRKVLEVGSAASFKAWKDVTA